MADEYKILGSTIYRISPDGNIVKFATVSDAGDMDLPTEDPRPVNAKRRRVWGYWVAIIVLAILACVWCVGMNLEMRDNRRNFSARLEAEQLLVRVSAHYPMIISDIEIGNVDASGETISNFGTNIYSRNAEYLSPRLKYTGLVNRPTQLKVRLYMPDGNLLRGSSSPSDATFSCQVSIEGGDNKTMLLEDWGWSTPGHWNRGIYRIEVWCADVCLKSKTFTIY